MFADFLDALFDDGNLVFRAPPPEKADDVARVGAVLSQAFAIYRLEFAGPLIDFDLMTALLAAEFVWRACWYLVHRDSPADEIQLRLTVPPPPVTPSQHLSGDLTFRHLPQLHRRARALSRDDVLTRSLVGALRAWPLAGVASDLDDPPMTPVDFSGHPGMEMLYAERFARRPRESWRPRGRIADYVELMPRKP